MRRQSETAGAALVCLDTDCVGLDRNSMYTDSERGTRGKTIHFFAGILLAGILAAPIPAQTLDSSGSTTSRS